MRTLDDVEIGMRRCNLRLLRPPSCAPHCIHLDLMATLGRGYDLRIQKPLKTTIRNIHLAKKTRNEIRRARAASYPKGPTVNIKAASTSTDPSLSFPIGKWTAVHTVACANSTMQLRNGLGPLYLLPDVGTTDSMNLCS